MSTRLISSESVTAGHPDKLCDQVSDAILTAYLKRDKNARVAVETSAANGVIIVFGEVRSTANINVQEIVRDTVRAIGYDGADTSLDADSVAVLNLIAPQSPEIAAGVDASQEVREGLLLDADEDPFDAQGAGDQGIMFGYATSETHSLMPVPITLAHMLTQRLTERRRDSLSSALIHGDEQHFDIAEYSPLLPDAKSQVTIRYEDGVPVAIDTVLISTQHRAGVDLAWLRNLVIQDVIKPVIEEFNAREAVTPLVDEGNYIINPAGSFVVGGPKGDAGLTGRKIIVDTYGGAAKHGGGAFSGKDPSKVDRSAAYALRWVAKNAVAAGLAERLEVQVAYAIGRARPVGLYVDSFGTGALPDEEIAEIIKAEFDLRPLAIIDALRLTDIDYTQTASGGHFGRHTFPWERTTHANALASALNSVKTAA